MDKLLIVDDEIDVLELLEELFVYDFSRELEVHTASSAKMALKLLDMVSFDVVLTDIKMPGMGGLTFYEKIKENWSECKVVFLTGYRDFEDIYWVNKQKDVRYVLKSEDDDVIMQTVEDSFVELERQNEQKRIHEVQKNYMEKARYRQGEGKNINFSLLKHYLELHQREAYFALLNDVCRMLGESKGRHDMHAMEIYYNVSTVLLQFINDNHLQESLAFKIGLYKLLNVDEHCDWLDAGAYLTALSEEIFSILGDYENSLSEHALGRIVEYIDIHMDGDLSLTNLAAIGGFNASYLSRLFKQVHNESISDYVLKKRMELAKTLLSDKQDKIQEIGERIGYNSSNSFSRAFKGYTGLSPIEYREAIQAERGKGLSEK